MSGLKEEDVALTCLDSDDTDVDCYRARLLRYSTDTPQPSIIYRWAKKSQGSTRLALKADKNGRFCLFLKTLQKSDEGLYKCEIWEGWDVVLVKNISLKVKDCRILQPVKATPQSPVKLNCQVNVTSGLQTPVNISWAKLQGNNPVNVEPKTAEVNGTFLAFWSVKTSDSGWYRCSLEQTQRCSEINLHVTENTYATTTVPVNTDPTTQQAPTATESEQINTKEQSSETSGPLVSLVVIGSFILVVSAAFFIYRRHKTQREAQTQLRHTTGSLVDSLDVYENLTLPRLQDSGNRVNSLYHCPEDSVRTFQY